MCLSVLVQNQTLNVTTTYPAKNLTYAHTLTQPEPKANDTKTAPETVKKPTADQQAPVHVQVYIPTTPT